MLILKQNRVHPETASLFISFKDGEKGYLRFVPMCELEEIRRGEGEIKRRWEGCEDGS